MINYIIGGLLLLAVLLALAKIRRDKKNGNCCGGCSGCSSAGHCSGDHAFEEDAKAALPKDTK